MVSGVLKLIFNLIMMKYVKKILKDPDLHIGDKPYLSEL